MKRFAICSLLLLGGCAIPVKMTVDNTCTISRFRFSEPTKVWLATEQKASRAPQTLKPDLDRLRKQQLTIEANC